MVVNGNGVQRVASAHIICSHHSVKVIQAVYDAGLSEYFESTSTLLCVVPVPRVQASLSRWGTAATAYGGLACVWVA